jgi:broad specificity phosphatase PhoE
VQAADDLRARGLQDSMWTADVRESDAHLAQRAAAFLRWLMARPEQHIAVVTHSSWLSVMVRAAAAWLPGCAASPAC